MLHDCHMHSRFSFDSKMNEIDACNKAESLGLKGITFTEHLDFDFPEESYSHPDLAGYITAVNKAKDDFPNLQVLHGLEFGYQEHVMNRVNEILDKYPFDYVINSVHVLDGKDLYESYYEGRSKHDVYTKYLQEIDRSLRASDYDTIGHIGYLRRYSPYADYSLAYADYTDLLDSILKGIVIRGKGLDVNTSGYRDVFGRILQCPIPGYDIIRRYVELGGETLVLGSDAHNCDSIGHGFNETRDMLVQLGVRYAAYFENRKVNFYKIY